MDDQLTNGNGVAGAEAAVAMQQSRRRFLSMIATGAVGAAATAASAAPGCATDAFEQYFQQHYQRLTPEEKERIFARIERQTRERYGVEVHVSDPKPLDDLVQSADPGSPRHQDWGYAYALNLSYCIGCRRCEYACARENNTSRNPEIHYIRVLSMEKGSLDLEKSDSYYAGEVPVPGRFYMPVQCHHCRAAPCTRACPVAATWKEPDGIVVVDYDWCIGCRYCEAACPYWARRFNFAEPRLPPSEINPDQAYLSNRLRKVGVVEKCTFCLQRTRRGLHPACVEVCPTGSRKFGNLLDPESSVRRIIETKRIYILKEELGTFPRFYYFFD